MKRPLVLLFIAAALLFVKGAAADEAPRFLVESVAVQGARYSSPRIIVAESRLESGQSYTETELHDALLRVQRLPFVLHADIRLERGSERGRYIIELVIEETKPLFISYRSLMEAIDSDRLVSFQNDPVTHLPVFITEKTLLRFSTETPSVGLRTFVGARGVVTASADFRGEDTFSLGYTQYDLFGSRASASMFVTYRGYGFDLPPQFGAAGRRTTSFSDHLVWDMTAALPLFGNHALRATWHRDRQPYQVNPFGKLQVVRITYDHPTLTWVYNTTNDLLLPTSGLYIDGGLDSRKLLRFVQTDPAPPRQANHYLTRYRWDHEATAQLEKYWELTPAQSVSTGGSLLTSNFRQYQDYNLHTMYSVDLAKGLRLNRLGDLRLELEAERNFMHYSNESSYGAARAGLVLRNAWGIARLDFRYLGWRHRN